MLQKINFGGDYQQDKENSFRLQRSLSNPFDIYQRGNQKYMTQKLKKMKKNRFLKRKKDIVEKSLCKKNIFGKLKRAL